jgi:hypothetical protein
MGFTKPVMARQVHYNLHPEPQFTLVRGDPIKHEDIVFDTTSTLFVPKCKGDFLDPMNDAGFHLSQMKTDEFYVLPAKGVGIIVPYNLIEDSPDEFMFKAHVIDPMF